MTPHRAGHDVAAQPSGGVAGPAIEGRDYPDEDAIGLGYLPHELGLVSPPTPGAGSSSRSVAAGG